MAAFLLNFHVDSSGILPNFPSLAFLASAAILTCSGPSSLIASWLAFEDHLYSGISPRSGRLDMGNIRSGDKIIHNQFRFDLLQLLKHLFLFGSGTVLLQYLLSLLFYPD